MVDDWLTEGWFCCRFSSAKTPWGSSKANPRRKPPKTSGSGSRPCRTPGSRWPPWFCPLWLWWCCSSSSLSTPPPGPAPSSRLQSSALSEATDWKWLNQRIYRPLPPADPPWTLLHSVLLCCQQDSKRSAPPDDEDASSAAFVFNRCNIYQPKDRKESPCYGRQLDV